MTPAIVSLKFYQTISNINKKTEVFLEFGSGILEWYPIAETCMPTQLSVGEMSPVTPAVCILESIASRLPGGTGVVDNWPAANNGHPSTAFVWDSCPLFVDLTGRSLHRPKYRLQIIGTCYPNGNSAGASLAPSWYKRYWTSTRHWRFGSSYLDTKRNRKLANNEVLTYLTNVLPYHCLKLVNSH